jgi:hypothetical protein
VVEMLEGKFSDIPLQVLRARLNWDRVNNRLVSHKIIKLFPKMPIP